MALIGALFILPFLAFSTVGGICADKWSKNRILWITRIFELVTLVLGLIAFGLQSVWASYVLLFVLSTVGAILGPAKYGIIPEIVSKERFLFGNSVIAAFTYLGIIFGTALASFMTWLTQENFVIAMIIPIFFAVVGLTFSLIVPKTAAENPSKPFRFFVYAEVWDALKQMWQIPSLISASFAFCYFLFLGAFVQLNVIPYAIQDLGLSDIWGGYLFLATSVGLGLGAYLTDHISKGKIRLGLVPISGMGWSVLLLFLKWVTSPLWLVFVWMVIMGFLGGIFLVPPQAYILAASPEKDRGRNFATANAFSFLFALFASGVLYLLNVLMKQPPSSSFLWIALMNFLIMLALIWKTKWVGKNFLHEAESK